MDERSSLRIKADQAVRLTLLDETGEEFGGRILNYSRDGLGLLLERPVQLDTPVKIAWDNRLLLAEVCYCRPEGDGFAAGVCVRHALFDTEELAHLARRLLGDPGSTLHDAPRRS